MDELPLEAAEPQGIPASDVTMDFAAALAPAVGAVVLDDEAVVLDPATGASHLLDRSATLVLQCLDGRSSLAEIAADISEILGVDRATVDADVLDLVQSLGAAGLVGGVRRTEPPRDFGVPEGLPEGSDLSVWNGWPETATEQSERSLVLNWGTGCGFCTMIVDELAGLVAPLADHGTDVLLVTTGSPEALAEQLGEVRLPVVHVETPPEFFGAIGTPAAYVVDGARHTLEPIAVGAYDVPQVARRLAGIETSVEEVS